MKLIKILEILRKYGINEDYPIWAEHDIIGFCVNNEIISQEDLNKLEKLNVFYNEEYDSLTMFV